MNPDSNKSSFNKLFFKAAFIKLLLLQCLFHPLLSLACDPCALYNASRLFGHSAETYSLSLSNQYTTFNKAQNPQYGSARNGELVRGFNTTQLSAGYDLYKDFGLQLTLPLISRTFDQISSYRLDDDSDFGIGDMIIAGNYSFLDYRDGDFVMIGGVTAGIKLPTGDTGVLGDLEEEKEVHTQSLFKHHQLGSASGGRALTFGSGSVDYLAGLNFLARYNRYFFLSNAQYTFRTEGDFDYKFDDDQVVSAGPGYYFILDDRFTLGGRVVVSGEFKGSDSHNSQKVAYSSVSNIYTGPEIIATLGSKYFIEAGVDFRTSGEDASVTVVPQTKLRLSFSYRF